jgi:chaperonin GroEL (HSP60 family)
MVTELRNRHAAGITSAGINVRQGIVADMWAMKVIQPLLVNTSEISLATECVGMILKIGESSHHYNITFQSKLEILPLLFFFSFSR